MCCCLIDMITVALEWTFREHCNVFYKNVYHSQFVTFLKGLQFSYTRIAQRSDKIDLFKVSLSYLWIQCAWIWQNKQVYLLRNLHTLMDPPKYWSNGYFICLRGCYQKDMKPNRFRIYQLFLTLTSFNLDAFRVIRGEKMCCIFFGVWTCEQIQWIVVFVWFECK